MSTVLIAKYDCNWPLRTFKFHFQVKSQIGDVNGQTKQFNLRHFFFCRVILKLRFLFIGCLNFISADLQKIPANGIAVTASATEAVAG